MRWYINLFLSSLFITCCNDRVTLDSIFAQLERQSPRHLIEDFKNSPLDSVVINNSHYDHIFVKTAGDILADPEQADQFERFFKQKEIEIEGKQVKWAIIAAFHNKLNGKKYNFPDLLNQMIELSNKVNEDKYGGDSIRAD